MRKLHTVLAAIAMVAGAAHADDLVAIPGVTTTGNVAMTTNYKFRGEDQSAAKPAVQGGLTFTHASGAYLSTWGSSISFGGSSEIDVMLGYGTAVGEGAVDVGVMRYIYPHSVTEPDSVTDYDFNELYASYGVGTGAVKGDKIKVSTAYSNEYFNETGPYYRLGLDYSVPVGPVGLQLTAAYNDVTDSDTGTFVDYKGAVNFAINGVTAEVAYIGATGDAAKNYDAMDGQAVFTLSKSF